MGSKLMWWGKPIFYATPCFEQDDDQSALVWEKPKIHQRFMFDINGLHREENTMMRMMSTFQYAPRPSWWVLVRRGKNCRRFVFLEERVWSAIYLWQLTLTCICTQSEYTMMLFMTMMMTMMMMMTWPWPYFGWRLVHFCSCFCFYSPLHSAAPIMVVVMVTMIINIMVMVVMIIVIIIAMKIMVSYAIHCSSFLMAFFSVNHFCTTAATA